MLPTSLAALAEIARVNGERAEHWPDPSGGTLCMTAVQRATVEGEQMASEAQALGVCVVESDG